MKYQLSIIIPVLGESSTINQTIERLYHLKFSQHAEIIVIDGNPQMDTIQAITDSCVKKEVAKKGRGSQMNKGADIAKGDILIFLHADTTMEHHALERILNTLHHQHVVGGAFDWGILSQKVIFRIIEKVVFIRSRIMNMPYGDQVIFIKRKFFHQIGGFREIPIMEDVDLIRRIKNSGGKITIISSKVQTSPRRWEREGILYCTVRNWMLVSLFFIGVYPAILARFYKETPSIPARRVETKSIP